MHIGMDIFGPYRLHPLGEARYDVRSTPRCAHGRVATRRNSSLFLLLAPCPAPNGSHSTRRSTAVSRFIVEHGGYLETVDYAPGRELSLIGVVTGTKEGKIDAATTIYPAVTAQQMHLWPKGGGNSEPRFNFGFGVMFHN